MNVERLVKNNKSFIAQHFSCVDEKLSHIETFYGNLDNIKDVSVLAFFQSVTATGALNLVLEHRGEWLDFVRVPLLREVPNETFQRSLAWDNQERPVSEEKKAKFKNQIRKIIHWKHKGLNVSVDEIRHIFNVFKAKNEDFFGVKRSPGEAVRGMRYNIYKTKDGYVRAIYFVEFENIFAAHEKPLTYYLGSYKNKSGDISDTMEVMSFTEEDDPGGLKVVLNE